MLEKINLRHLLLELKQANQ